jgi:hypothetical protein
MAQAAAMDVDRISGMGGVGQEQTPSWNREKMRRKKFAEEVPPEMQEEQPEDAALPVEDEHDGQLNVVA